MGLEVMPRIAGLTDAQTRFIRALGRHPTGPPAQLWPSPMILRRSSAQPRFCEALNEIGQVLKFQRDVHLCVAGVGAAFALRTPPRAGTSHSTVTHNLALLRLSREVSSIKTRWRVHSRSSMGSAL